MRQVTVEFVPPGHRADPGPEVTLEDVLEELINAAERGAGHIAIYQPRADLLIGAHMAKVVLARHRALKKMPIVVELPEPKD